MKKILLQFSLITSLLLSSPISHAISIDIPGYDFAAIASDVDASTGSFFTNGLIDSNTSITDIQAATWVKGDVNDPDPSSLTLSFGTDVFDGPGADLSIFYAGGASGNAPHPTTITLFDGTSSSSLFYDINFDPTDYTGYCIEANFEPGCLGNDLDIYVLHLDFADFNFLGANALALIQLDISGGVASPSLVGANYTSATVVPLPLPVVLFSSGLALLGFVSRKRA